MVFSSSSQNLKLETWSLIPYNTETNGHEWYVDSLWQPINLEQQKKPNRDVWEIEACANDKIFRANCVNQDQIDR